MNGHQLSDLLNIPPPPPGFVPVREDVPIPPPGFVPITEDIPAPPPGFIPVEITKAEEPAILSPFLSSLSAAASRLNDELRYGTFSMESFEHILEPLKGMEVKGTESEQIATILTNLGKEAATLPLIPGQIAAGLAERPFETAQGLARFFPEMSSNLITAAQLNPIVQIGIALGKQESIDELARARQAVAQNPLFHVLGAVGLRHVLAKGGKGLAKAEETVGKIQREMPEAVRKAIQAPEKPVEAVTPEIRPEVPIEPVAPVKAPVRTVPGLREGIPVVLEQQIPRPAPLPKGDVGSVAPKPIPPLVAPPAVVTRMVPGLKGGIPVAIKQFKFEDTGIESRWQEARGVKKESLPDRIKSQTTTFKNKATREFEHLPHTKEFSQLRFDLLRLRKQHGVSGDKTVRFIDSITKPLDKPSYDLFRRKVILEDFNEVAKEGGVPFGFDAKSVTSELSRVNEVMTPLIEQQFAKRTAMWDQLRGDYTKSMKDIGFNVEDRLTRPNYFRHQVLEHAEAKSFLGTGKQVKTPTGRGFLKKRTGSQLDINTDYVQAEYEVISQMLYDIETANVLKGVMERGEDIAPRLKRAARKEKIEDWHDLIPEGYVAWQPREGNVFYMTESISQRIAQQLTEGNLIKLLPEDTGKVLAMGRRRKEYVVKEEIAATLDNFGAARSDNVIIGGSRKALRGWKMWQLLSPRRFAKYNIRNLTGDAEAAWLGNPSGFRYAPRAAKELYDVMVRDKEMTPEFRDWFERGGIQSTLQALEMGELNKMGRFIRLQEAKGKPGEIPLKVWQKYWGAVRVSTDIREATLRYSNYLDYLDQMKVRNGNPKNFGASIPEEVLGLRDIKDRAYTLSNDLLGAYDKVGVVGQHLREQLIPFWSWKEVNFRRYIQFTKNAIDDGHLPQLVGRKLVGSVTKSPYKIYRVGKFAIKATAFWSALQTWNKLKFPELEASLSEQEQSTPHVIFGTDKEGNIISFNRMGTLGDFIEWFGLDAAPAHISDFMAGKKTIREIAIEMVKSPVNVVAQGFTPFIKLPAELLTRQALFPDVFEPRAIRDNGFQIARGFGLGNEYKAVMGLPSRPYKESVPGFFIYKTDPLQSAYGKIRNDVARYKKSIGKGSEGFWITPRGDALYNIKLAARYDDPEAYAHYSIEYAGLGGTPEGMKQSFDRLNPLAPLNIEEREQFVNTLNEEDIKNFAKALRYWDELKVDASEEFMDKVLKEIEKVKKKGE